jgi:hypothetical protein
LLSRHSKFPLQNRSEFLNGRELTRAAHDDALFVILRTNSNRAAEDFFKAPPDCLRAVPAASLIARPINTSPASTATMVLQTEAITNESIENRRVR